jgi:putative nucleotidyltransferase with HDIG domain
MASVTFAAPLKTLLGRIDRMARDAGIDAYVVGGSVRDALLGRPMRDLDLAVSGDALAFARRLADALAGHFVTLDDENAVARVVLDEAAVTSIDVAQLQGDLEADLRRRDLTIDALAVRLGAGAVIDVSGGLDDLAAHRVRSNGARVFDNDPLRLLRSPRIAAELGFDIEPATADAIRERAQRVLEAAPERRRDELARIFALDAAGPALRLLDDLRLLEVLLPEVTAGRDVSQPSGFHSHDVFGHAIAAVDAMDVLLAVLHSDSSVVWMWDTLWTTFEWYAGCLRTYIDGEVSEGRSRGALLKLAALLHDVGKPQTRTVDADGRIRFLGHADAGAAMASTLMRGMRFSSGEAHFVATLVREHLRPVQLAQIGEAPTARALYRFHRDTGEALEGVILVSLADGAAAAGDRLTREGWARQVAYMNSLIVRLQGEGGIVGAPRLLTGHDIMSAFGITEGPRIGRLLEAVREAQAAGDVHDRDGAQTVVRAQLA